MRRGGGEMGMDFFLFRNKEFLLDRVRICKVNIKNKKKLRNLKNNIYRPYFLFIRIYTFWDLFSFF